MVDRIEANIKQSSDYVVKAKENTQQAVTYQKKARKVRVGYEWWKQPECDIKTDWNFANVAWPLSHRAEEDVDRRVLGRPHLHPGHRTCVRLRLLNSQSECWAASARPGFRNPFSCKYSELTGRRKSISFFFFLHILNMFPSNFHVLLLFKHKKRNIKAPFLSFRASIS